MPEADLALLIDAAKASGEIAKRYFSQSYDIVDKPDNAGPVTAADLAVNQMLHAELIGARPDYGWLSEETEDDQQRLRTKRQFVIDPIDGTRAFIQGGKDWAHALAVVEDGKVTTAAVYLPIRDIMFTATKGGGAGLNGAPISAKQSQLAGAEILGTKPNFDPKHWRGGLPPIKRVFRSSLAYRLCLVAQGRFDGMMTLHPSWEWDIAAGALIAAEAGAQVTDPSNRPLHFNSAFPKVPGVISAGPMLHNALMARLEPRSAKP